MLCIFSHHTDPAFNLATEEYVLNSVGEDTFLVWRNGPTVIIGRNQNPYRQADTGYLQQMDIPLLRRISGGGAVFHDAGNVNFTFIHVTIGQPRVDYQPFLGPVVRFLRSMGVAAQFDGTNGLVVGGKKISGNAQHIHQGMVLHHGTLLWDTDLDALHNALATPGRGRYRDRSVDSVRQPVTNLRPLMNMSLSVEDFMGRLLAHIQMATGGRRIELSEKDIAAIEALADSKYRTWEWNFGHSPDYRFSGTLPMGGRKMGVHMQVSSGIIRQMEISRAGVTDSRISALITILPSILQGCRHDRSALAAALLNGSPLVSPAAVDLPSIVEALF